MPPFIIGGGACPAKPFVRSNVLPGLMIGASASACSFCTSFFARSFTSFSSCLIYRHTSVYYPTS